MADINSRDARPSSLDDVIGQQQVVETVKVALAAARADGTKFEHSLLVGPPGLGKTQISQIIGTEMASGYREVLAQSLASINDVNGLLLASRDKGVVLLDEIHEADPGLQTYLFQVIDTRKLTLQSGRKSGGPPLQIRCPDVSLLLATTDEFRVLAPLRQRCRLNLRFSFYAAEDLSEICHQRAESLGWQVDSTEIFNDISRRSRGTPRLALRLLQAAYRVSRSRSSEIITLDDLIHACRLEGVDENGLGPMDRQYLEVLGEGPTQLNVLASRLGTLSQTVAQVIEPFLIRAGLIAKGEGSRRQLTAKGLELQREVLVG
jgi:Holliday junction DNA helicase RuvB